MRLAILLACMACGSGPPTIQSGKYEVTTHYRGGTGGLCYEDWYELGDTFETIWDFQRVGAGVWIMKPFKATNTFLGREDSTRTIRLKWDQVKPYYSQDVWITVWPASKGLAGHATDLLFIHLPDEEPVTCEDNWSVEGEL